MNITSLEFIDVISENIKISGGRNIAPISSSLQGLFLGFRGRISSEGFNGFESDSDSEQASGINDVSSEASSQAVSTPPEN